MKKSCGTCKFWKKSTDFKAIVNDGICTEIERKLTIEVTYGWDGGYVNYIETEEDFCCSLYEKGN